MSSIDINDKREENNHPIQIMDNGTRESEETCVNIEDNLRTDCSHLLNQSHSNNQVEDVPSPPSYSQIPGTVPLHTGRSNGPPPTYDEVINPNIAPPSYQSLFGQVREARKSANGFIDFLRKVAILILGTLGVTVLIGFTVLIPFTMILIGASHMDQCPAENIPTFLLVGGIVWVLKNSLNFWSSCRRNNMNNSGNEAEFQARHKKRESLLNCFLFGWFIAGCVLVYRIYPPNYEDRTSSHYCNRLVYFYAFWLVTLTFTIFGLFMGCLCCLTLSSMLAVHP